MQKAAAGSRRPLHPAARGLADRNRGEGRGPKSACTAGSATAKDHRPTQPSVLSVIEATRRIQEYDVSMEGMSGGTPQSFGGSFIDALAAQVAHPYELASSATKQDFSFVARAGLMHSCGPALPGVCP